MNAPLFSQDFYDINRRYANTTKGPWQRSKVAIGKVYREGIVGANREPIFVEANQNLSQIDKDLDFIAACYNDIPLLIEECEILRLGQEGLTSDDIFEIQCRLKSITSWKSGWKRGLCSFYTGHQEGVLDKFGNSLIITAPYFTGGLKPRSPTQRFSDAHFAASCPNFIFALLETVRIIKESKK